VQVIFNLGFIIGVNVIFAGAINGGLFGYRPCSVSVVPILMRVFHKQVGSLPLLIRNPKISR
jgi:hypothetical protein